MKKQVRNNKPEPFVEDLILIESNPNYATVRFKGGRKITVSLKLNQVIYTVLY